MNFSAMDTAIRQLGNGVLFVSAIILIIAMSRYIASVRHDVGSRWMRDIGVQGAFAIIVLMVGHAIRAGGSWASFVYVSGVSPDFIENTFALAVCIILVGKLAIVYFFSNPQWRWRLTMAALILSLAIPVIVFVAMN